METLAKIVLPSRAQIGTPCPMMSSTRFVVAIHILVAIQVQEGKPIPSDVIADSVNSHASVVRRILMSLNKAKITKARLGSGGGAVLARPASDISLLDIYDAVEGETTFSIHRDGPNTACMIGRNILAALDPHLNRAQAAFRGELAAVKLDDVARDVLERGKISGGLFQRL